MNPISKSQQENPLELRSEEIDEILGKAPNSIIRWGISIIFLLVLLVFAISYIVKYPETIKAEITLYSENMPTTLVAKISGKISKNLFYSIILPNELKTTYKKELSFKSGMTGNAEIITEDFCLIERFINPIKAVLKR